MRKEEECVDTYFSCGGGGGGATEVKSVEDESEFRFSKCVYEMYSTEICIQ